jgi:3-methyladenine DNA glycosylase AlkD
MNIQSIKEEVYGCQEPTFVVSKMPGSSLKWARTPVPHLKEVAKALATNQDVDLEIIPLDESVELQTVYFMANVIRLSPFYVSQLDFILAHSDLASSWMVTDGVLQYLKKANLKEYRPYYLKLLKKKDVFSRRFAYVLALGFYKEDDISVLLKHLLKDNRYYVLMGEAWLLANLAMTHFDEVYSYLDSDKLTLECKRKAISKMCDSYRISPEHKKQIKLLRSTFSE